MYAALSTRGGVSSQIHLATMEGLKILEDGGNGFDAAIAVSSMLTVLLPYTSSIGGDGFLLALTSNDELVAYNGSGRSSRSFPVEEYLREKPVRGPLTVTVPGLVDMWDWLSREYGSVDLKMLLRKATSLARNGFTVQEPLAMAVKSNEPALQKYEEWVKTFGCAEGGSNICFPKLAEIYEDIGRKGADGFYRSKYTEEIVETLTGQGVKVTCEDFADHKGGEVEPVGCEYKDYELLELPPNSQGISTLQLLKAIDVADINTLPNTNADRLREFFAAAARTYEDRDRHVADPDYYRLPIDQLLSAKYLGEKAAHRRAQQRPLKSDDTTFFVVADRQGNLVGLIQSIFRPFGSGIVACDIPFQSRAVGFAKEKGLPNSPYPGKRPMHTLSILLARHKEQGDFMIGCAGGDLRPQIHAEVFTNIADYEMRLSEAVHAPRYILTSWQKEKVSALVEEGCCTSQFPNWISKTRFPSPDLGIVHAARRMKNGVCELVADLRGGGLAAPLL